MGEQYVQNCASPTARALQLEERKKKQTFKNVNTWCVLVPVTSTVSIIVNSTPFLWVNDIICSFLQNSCPANCKRKHGERKGGAMKSPGGDDEHTVQSICPTSEEFSHSRLKKHTVQIICPTSEEFSHNRLKKRHTSTYLRARECEDLKSSLCVHLVE